MEISLDVLNYWPNLILFWKNIFLGLEIKGKVQYFHVILTNAIHSMHILSFEIFLGRASYLSSTICEEFISIMAKSVKDQIISEIIESHYYSLSVDSTPDVSHTDQLSFCVRYVKSDIICERFISFIAIEGHTSTYLFDTLMKFHEESQINIDNCRGQSYDNAPNMAGIYSGLQSLILQKNEAATFVPCGAHSLNLVGKNSVSGNTDATNFFDMVEKLYGFFVYSPFRWNRLQEQITGKDEYMLKRATGTRWSAKNEAVRAFMFF